MDVGEGVACADPEFFVRGGSNLIFFILFFFVDEGRGSKEKTLKVGHHR